MDDENLAVSRTHDKMLFYTHCESQPTAVRSRRFQPRPLSCDFACLARLLQRERLIPSFRCHVGADSKPLRYSNHPCWSVHPSSCCQALLNRAWLRACAALRSRAFAWRLSLELTLSRSV